MNHNNENNEPTPAVKPMWLIAQEWIDKARDLMDENAKLKAELARCQSNDYAGDICADCEDGGQVAQHLKG